ncbi:MAG: class I SAM-dependent rRNA methyltransferase [Sphingomonadales bacterium]|nr:class I SAM-dependent rRNA methyltransferase [Sphingomonadales bacterium]
MKKAVLKPGKEVSLLRKHPWVFTGAIQEIDEVYIGDWVQVFDHKGRLLGTGQVGDGSIAIRMVAFEAIEPNTAFWQTKLANCLALRKQLGFGLKTPTTAYRLVHGEGDNLPGLIIDIYNDCAVIQAHSLGMYNSINHIAEALENLKDLKLKTIYNKSFAAMHGAVDPDGFLLGDTAETIAKENNLLFTVNWVTGQKTGFFLDQRDNRDLLRQFAKDKSVLNTFCYTGGFSVAALAGGATKVISADISQTAIDLANNNASLMKLQPHQSHEGLVVDVMKHLGDVEQQFDIVVLDPPAFAKSLSKKHKAVMGYKRLNAMGMKRVSSGGLLFTFSCSQVVDDVLFANTVTAAGIEAGRNCRILYRLGQGADHPVNLYHPEGHYLKGLVIQVE